MQRHNRSFLSIASLALVAVASSFYTNIALPMARMARTLVSFACEWVVTGLKLAGRSDGDGFARPALRLKQAQAFALRIAKRERPVRTASWRMCPST